MTHAPVPAPRLLFLGVDIGQSRDSAAYVGVVPDGRRPGGILPKWRAAVCETAPLGTPYRAVAGRARQLLDGLDEQGWACLAAVDATGVGRPVVEMIREDPHPAGDVLAVTSHGGYALTGQWPDVRVPKRHLVASLGAAVDNQAFTVPPSLPAASRLGAQLRAYREKRNARTGHVRHEAAREADHDDLVAALQLAVWAGDHWFTVNAARLGRDRSSTP